VGTLPLANPPITHTPTCVRLRDPLVRDLVDLI